MLNRKAIIKRWNQTHQHPQPRTRTIPKPASPLPPPQPKNYEKLRKKIWEMKHRVCVLEFGLGSIAKIVGGLGEDGVSCGGTADGELCVDTGGNKYRDMVIGIGEILRDVEKCVGSSQGGGTQSLRSDQITHDTATTAFDNSEQPQKLDPPKARIYIDETTSGENSLTLTTNIIQTVETPTTMYSQPPHQHENTITVITNPCQSKNELYNSDPIMSPLPSFDALSTLASVASSKHAEELAKTCQLVNPFVFSEETGESDSLSGLRKRKRVSGSGGTSSRGRMNTRRVARQN